MRVENPATAPDPADTVAVLRAAAQVLHRATRDRPRGPWRWGDPEVGDEQDAGPSPYRESWSVLPPHRRPSPVDEPVPLGRPDPFGPVPADLPPPRPDVRPGPATGLDPEIAESLSVLLDVLAGQVERDDRGVDPDTVAGAVAVARSVLRWSVPRAVDTADHIQH